MISLILDTQEYHDDDDHVLKIIRDSGSENRGINNHFCVK